MNTIPDLELKSPHEIRAFQEEALQKLIRYIGANSPFYKNHFKAYSISHQLIHSLDDLKNVPPVTKEDLQRFNWDFLCVPKDKIIEYTSTSGTLGKPVTIALTENDVKRLAYNECISFACANGSSNDLYQLMLTLDRQFMAGIAYYEGIRKLGAGLVRIGPGVPQMQFDAIDRIKPTTLVAVPSFILKLIEYAEQNNIDLNNTSVKKAICIGENIRTPSFELNTVGKKIKQRWHIDLFSTYASTEMQTAFTECEYGSGGHHHPELVIVELLDDHNNPVVNGSPGELTITTLGVEGMPLLRFKTGDIASAHTLPCACGRTTLRLGPLVGRKQQMIKLKGTTIYPPAIFDILNEIGAISNFVVEVFSNDLETDELRLHLLVAEHDKESVSRNLLATFQSRLRVAPHLNFTSANQIDQLQLGNMDRKIKRFIDRRATLLK